MLLLGAALLTARTAISFITGSAIVYFAQPMATAVAAALVLIGSAALGRPLTQRFVHDFCPIDPELLARPRVRRFFVRVSLLWATVLVVNAGITLWLLLSFSLRTFVLERTAATWGLTMLAIFLSITWFVASLRKDGITVEWGTATPANAPSRRVRLIPGHGDVSCFRSLARSSSAWSSPRSPSW